MIKFFRTIRRNLLAEGKTSKYLLYAIGEIVLVVIGILIALQINNWNENQKADTKEANYLVNLERDLNDQMASIAQQIYYEAQFTEDARYVLNYYNKNGLKTLDSLFFAKLSNLHSRKTFVITDPTYTDLLSSGNINLIRRKNFKDQCIQYYQELERIEKIIQNNNSLLTDQQFGSVFLNLGYYYLDNKTNSALSASVEPEGFTELYNPKLAIIAEEVLAIPSNQLKLLNAVNIRHLVSSSHLELMQKSKQETEKLLQELRKKYND